jgi:HSP20 family protein
MAEARTKLPERKGFQARAELAGMDARTRQRSPDDQGEKGCYLHERRFGSFERSFPMPEGVDTDKIEGTFKKGVFTVMLPKKPEDFGAAPWCLDRSVRD